MDECIGILFLVVLMGSFVMACASEGRSTNPHAPSPPAPPPDEGAKAAPRVPSWGERTEAVGIHRVVSYEAMGAYGLEASAVRTEDGTAWCPYFYCGPEWLGRLFIVGIEDLRASEKEIPASAQCDRCDRVMSEALFEIVKRTVPPGGLDQGLTEPRALGRCCGKCGDFAAGRAPASQALGALWDAHRNLFDLVEALESDEAKLKLKEAQLARVEAELDDVECRRGRLTHERLRLQEELGLLKGPPGRDRFADAKGSED